jgi:nucleotide-binding universal stress UspA family protein
MKILLAVDGSKYSEAAARSVAARPWPDGSQVRVVSAYEHASLVAMPEVGGAATDLYEKMSEAARGRARGAIKKVEQIVKEGLGARHEVSSCVIEGYPKEAILDEAEKWGADLIVVGSHGYRGLTKLWLGSVSSAIASHARCSVEIVRTQE